MKDFTMSRYSLEKENQKKRKRGGFYFKSFVLLSSLLIFTATSSWGQCTPEQVDALFTIEVDGQPGDWNLLDLSPQVTYSHISDPWGSGVVDDQFTQGSKDPDFVEDLRWSDGQTKNKNDIANAAGFLESVKCNGETYTRLFFAGDRLSTNGTSQIGMWFYQGGVAPKEGTNIFEGEHVPGDILALINFTGGGANAQVEIYSWNAEGDGDYGGGNLDFLGTEQHKAVQIQIGENVPENWDFPEINGERRYDVNQFFEGYINLNAFGESDLDYCFNRFLIEGRSSQTLTASLDDFASGELNIKPTVTVSSDAVCDGDMATVTATPGSGLASDYNYDWTVPADAVDPGNVVSFDTGVEGTYSVVISYKVLDINCQSEEATGTVTINPDLNVTVADVSACYEADAIFTANASGGTAPYSYAWTVDGVAAGTDSSTLTLSGVTDDAAIAVTVTDAFDNGDAADCTASDTAALYVNPDLSVTVADVNACYEADAIFTANASGGTAPYSYAWTVDGVAAGTDSSTLTLSGVTADAAIAVTVTDAFDNGDAADCTASDTADLDVNPDLSVIVADVNACYEADAIFTANASGGTAPYSYVWTVDGVAAGTDSSTLTLSGVTADAAIAVTVTDVYDNGDAADCTASDTAALDVNPDLSVTVADVNACYEADAIFTANASGGTAPYSYAWTVDGVAAGTDSSTLTLSGVTADAAIAVTVTDVYDNGDAADCTASDTAALDVNADLSVTVADVNACYEADAIFTANASGGTAPYSYAWTVDGVAAGTDSSTLTVSGVTADAAIAVTVTDAYDNGDAADCTASDTADLDVNPGLSVTVADVNACYEADAIFTANASGGAAPYSYAWTVDGVAAGTDSNTLTLSGVTADAVIAVAVTDAFDNGDTADCIASDTAALDVNADLSVTVADVNACYEADAIFTANASGGTAPYSYAWTIDGVAAGTDSSTLTLSAVTAGAAIAVTVTDAYDNGDAADCTASDTAALDVNSDLSVTVADVGACYEADAIFTANVSGGTAPYSYAWTVDGVAAGTDSSTLTLSSVTAGAAIAVTVSDAYDNGDAADCTATDDGSLFIYPEPSCSASNSGPVCAGDDVMLYETGGDAVSWLWSSNGAATFNDNTLQNPTASGAVDGEVFTVMITDINDCTSTCTTTVTVEMCMQEGCTLGYWKNHTDRWCDEYETCTTYAEAFYNGAYEDAPAELRDLTLLEVLNLGGGGIYNLGRQSVAALLNTCSSGMDDIDFYYSNVTDLINDVRMAIANGEAGSFASQLDMWNQEGCPLGGSRATTEPSDGCPVHPPAASQLIQQVLQDSPYLRTRSKMY